MEFNAGQYVDIGIPGAEGEHRSFSMANAPGEPDRLEFMIKLYEGGRFSGLLANGHGITVGDELTCKGPFGMFTLRDSSPRRLVFIAGGAGMAPVLSLLRSMAEKGTQRPATFYYGARTEDDLFALEEIERLCGSAARLHVRPRALQTTRSGTARRGSSPTSSTASEDDLTEVDAYLCGPPPMVDAAIALLERRGVPRVAHLFRQVHDDRGLTASRRGSSMPAGTTVTSERSVPKPVFTDAEAGAKEFPSSRSRSYNYFEPRKRRATVYEDVTVDVQPDPERHLTQGWVYAFANGDSGYPQEWTALKSEQLARVPRSQRGVGADDLPQQRQHGAADQRRCWRTRRQPTPSPAWNRAWVEGRRAPRVGVGARRARPRHARLHARPARRADEHDQQRDVRRRGAQAALRAGHHPLQPRGLRADRGLRRRRPQGRLAERPDLAGRRARTSRS